MAFTDDTVKSAEFTIYFRSAGNDLYGNPLYTFANFCKMRVNDPSDKISRLGGNSSIARCSWIAAASAGETRKRWVSRAVSF